MKWKKGVWENIRTEPVEPIDGQIVHSLTSRPVPDPVLPIVIAFQMIYSESRFSELAALPGLRLIFNLMLFFNFYFPNFFSLYIHLQSSGKFYPLLYFNFRGLLRQT